MNAANFLVRTALAVDIPALTELVNSAYRGDSSRAGWTTEADFLEGQRTDARSLREFLNAPESRRLLMLTEGEILLACVCLERVATATDVACYLGMLTVSPRAQNRGLGKSLLTAAELEATRWGASCMTISVIQLRHSLIDWYKRRGYRATGERKEFPYGDPRFGIPKRDDLHFEVFEKPLPL